MDTNQFQEGLARLSQPVLPLVRLVEILFLTGPFATVDDVLSELIDPVETVVRYEDPVKALTPYGDLLQEFVRLKAPAPARYSIMDSEGNPLPVMEAVDLWVGQQVLARELESINSLLCGPCGCALCCVGPGPEYDQVYFEIPLQPAEADLFSLPRIDTFGSRQTRALDEPPLLIEGAPFYHRGANLVHWRSGWSMILPTAAACPHLTPVNACAIYPERPEVCRRPQIFPYLIERLPDRAAPGSLPIYRQRGAILAIWDCPYVKRFQNEIAAYAERCELEPVFKVNKA